MALCCTFISNKGVGPKKNGPEEPLHVAAFYGHLKCLKCLIRDYHFDPNEDNGFSLMTPLHYAVSGNHLNCMKFLIENGADYNAKNYENLTPFDYATNEEVIFELKSYIRDFELTNLIKEPSED